MPGWASNWKHRTLESIGVEVNPDTIRLMSAWLKSTPLDPWTNNPLGMPSSAGRVQSVPGTLYAMFPSIVAFYSAIGAFSKTPDGREIVRAIGGIPQYGPIWRAISATNWPAVKTETDWPYHVLELAGQSYMDSVMSSTSGKRKSAGSPQASPAIHETMRKQAESLNHAASAFTDARSAVRFLIRRHARYGN